MKVGDVVILTGAYRKIEPRELVVYKIGRRWAYAKPAGGGWPDIKFDMQTGYEDGRGYSPMHRCRTPERVAEDERRRAAVEQLKALGVRLEPHARSISTAALEKVVAVLAADAA